MFYVILVRILRRHAFFHLVVPLVVGVLVEAVYASVREGSPLTLAHLLSGERIVLYIGIAATYIIVISLLIRSETNIGLRRIELNELASKLRTAKSLFAVAPTPLGEWFDPAAQVYFATLLGELLASKQEFRYERVLLLTSRKSRRYLDSDYLDGYFAKCLIDIHKRLRISLYFLEWNEIEEVLAKLTVEEKISIGYYPPMASKLPESLTKILMLPVRRRRVRRIACGVMETSSGDQSAFSFEKHENVVDVKVQPPTRNAAYIKLADSIKAVLYEDQAGITSTKVKTRHDFTKYYAD